MSAAPATTFATITNWTIDPAHSVAEFKVKHMMISNVKGQFTKLSGALALDESDITRSSVHASIDVASISTGDPQRDTHLKSPDFFDVEQFPVFAFQSDSIVRKSDGELTVDGKLSIHGVTKSVTFAVEGPTAPGKDPWGNTRIGLSATTKINRKEFGLSWNAALETGGVLVGEDITISLEIQFVKSA